MKVSLSGLGVRTSEPRGGKALRRYETVVIAQANLPEDDMTGLIERYNSIIADRKGTVVKIDRWGVRKLAYDIRKQTRGAYVIYDFAGTSDVVAELERNLKIDDNVLKYMTVLTDPETTAENIMKEITALAKKETEEKVAASAETAAETPAAAPSAQTGEPAGSSEAPTAVEEK
ncbi:SSU ribosomal protein S6P [Syntrophus aciditrophicus SB]|uniref:Small ribosomal subunit protein bS6 n=1 Tax=Syntrophus aciditrophicus (strain SB) TaxID=56780 RepID=Q2LUJ8_SYNAS|nr:SSU ribosomal protein S6P [Syntrophus aciditrophicus SB]